MLPLNASDLPWWGWLLLTFGAYCVGLIVWCIADALEVEMPGEGDPAGRVAVGGLRMVSWLFWLSAAGSLLIGLVRFVKWAWSG
jgi:hypothetical protein